MVEIPGKHPALVTLDGNREVWGTVATPPDREHYPHTFLWDGAFVAIVRARYGDSDQAAAEVREILSGQKPDGMIPNMKFGPGRNWDPERRLTFLDRHASSDYTQPPLLAHASFEVYESYKRCGQEEKGKEFLNRSYQQLRDYYDYLKDTRTDPGSSLIAIMHPHETGRDSDPTFDFIKPDRLPQPKRGTFQRKAVDKINTAADYIDSLMLGRKLKNVGWDPDYARNIFWIKDVMMNAIYAQNLTYMAHIADTLGKNEDAEQFLSLSHQVEVDIQQMYSAQTEKFHAINADGRKFKAITVSNLFPLILPNTPVQQVEKTLELLEDPQWFNTEYPIPSVAVNSNKYDPSFSEHRLWRGPTWVNTNWYIMEGLLTQRDRFASENPLLAQRLNAKALHIGRKNAELIRREAYREFYNPETGKGMRVKNFAWSALAHLMEDRIPEMEAYAMAA